MSMAWVHYQVKLHGDSVLQDVWRKFLTDLGRSAKFRTFWRQIRRRCEATSRTQVINKVSLVFLQTSKPSALALCKMFKSYKWTEAIAVLHRCVYPSDITKSLRIFHYLHLLHIFGIPGIPQYHVCLESRLFHDATAWMSHTPNSQL